MLSLFILGGCNKASDDAATNMNGEEIASDKPYSTMSDNIELRDSDITKNVEIALSNDDALKGFKITVFTTNGNVRLVGTVDTQSQHIAVMKLVKETAGTNLIVDELSVVES
jgi:osmotically-inducible protein OsmY